MAKVIKCFVCGKEVKQAGGREKRFCSPACRSAGWRMGKTANPCFYCGVPADTIDHVPPRSVRPFIVIEKLLHKYPFHEVTCCHECNVLLGDRALWSLPKRKKFIKRTLRIRYKRLLAAPAWTDEEKKPMGYSLKVIIEQKELMRRVLLERLSWS